MNPYALNLIREFEGLHLAPYLCPAGVPTIGYGATRDFRGPVAMDRPPISRLEAELLLMRDAALGELAVLRHVQPVLSPKSVGALTSFVYNLGAGALARSTLLRRINGGEWDDVPRQFLRWNMAAGIKLAGLTRRRQAEAALFMEGINEQTGD